MTDTWSFILLYDVIITLYVSSCCAFGRWHLWLHFALFEFWTCSPRMSKGKHQRSADQSCCYWRCCSRFMMGEALLKTSSTVAWTSRWKCLHPFTRIYRKVFHLEWPEVFGPVWTDIPWKLTWQHLKVREVNHSLTLQQCRVWGWLSSPQEKTQQIREDLTWKEETKKPAMFWIKSLGGARPNRDSYFRWAETKSQMYTNVTSWNKFCSVGFLRKTTNSMFEHLEKKM